MNVEQLSDADNLILQTVEVPQANSLPKIFEVAVMLNDGVNDAESIAAGLGIVNREGAYYASAACAVRLARKRELADSIAYEITNLGEQYARADEAGRRRMMISRTLDAPHVKFVALQLGVALPLAKPIPRAMFDERATRRALDAFPNLQGSTQARRASTLISWLRHVDRL